MSEAGPDRRPRALVYYFGFPHYRREILESLRRLPSIDVQLVSGSGSKAGIKTLSRDDVPGLRTVPTVRVGPLLWDRGVVRAATARRWDDVVLGPAVTSVSTWATLVGRRLTGRRTFLWGQCGRLDDRSVKRALQEVMNRLATGLLVYGAAEAHAAQQWGTPAHKVHVVNNATESNAAWLSDETAASAHRRLRERALSADHDGRLRLLFVGRVNADKRLDVLLQAARTLRASYARTEVDVVGDGDARRTLQTAYPQEWVRFHGWVYDGPERERLFREATLVVSPFHMGLLAVDALRFGTPVLVPDNPHNGSEVEALTPGVNAVRFTPGDAASLAAAARDWLGIAEKVPEDLYTRARRAALEAWEPAAVAANIAAAITPRTS